VPTQEHKRILVTGGAGFIGSNLCEDLLKYDNEVVCLDNFSTGRMENIREMLDHKQFKLIVGDIRNPEDCHKAADGIDIILQEAALGSVPRSINDPVTTKKCKVLRFKF
jgi:UDP-N-acetylglucosamine 4-epimerase